MPHTNLMFVKGSLNCKMSAIAEQGNKVTNVQQRQNKMNMPLFQVKRYQCAKLKVLADSAISSGLKKMGVKGKQALTKLLDIAYYIALKGRLFTDFKDLIDLEKLHGVKFQSSAYENETSCRDFITSSTVSQNFPSRITYIKNF